MLPAVPKTNELIRLQFREPVGGQPSKLDRLSGDTFPTDPAFLNPSNFYLGDADRRGTLASFFHLISGLLRRPRKSKEKHPLSGYVNQRDTAISFVAVRF